MKTIEQLIEDCPKTFKIYKNYLISKYEKNKYELKPFLTDEMLILNLKSVPMSISYFFDSVDFIGTIHYNGLEERFEVSFNGELVESDEKENNTTIFLGSKDRQKAEALLINYLFTEYEKTL